MLSGVVIKIATVTRTAFALQTVQFVSLRRQQWALTNAVVLPTVEQWACAVSIRLKENGGYTYAQLCCRPTGMLSHQR